MASCGSTISCRDIVTGCYDRRCDFIVGSTVVGGTVIKILGIIVVVVVLGVIDVAVVVGSVIVFVVIAHSSGDRQRSPAIASTFQVSEGLVLCCIGIRWVVFGDGGFTAICLVFVIIIAFVVVAADVVRSDIAVVGVAVVGSRVTWGGGAGRGKAETQCMLQCVQFGLKGVEGVWFINRRKIIVGSVRGCGHGINRCFVGVWGRDIERMCKL